MKRNWDNLLDSVYLLLYSLIKSNQLITASSSLKTNLLRLQIGHSGSPCPVGLALVSFPD